jgi:hypothetical protein
MRRANFTLRAALADDGMLGVLAGDSWRNWRIVLMGAMGEPLSWGESRIFKRLAGGQKPPKEPCDELVCVIGRRGGKSRATAVLATYLAALCSYDGVAAPGERLLVLCLARNQKQAVVVFNLIAGIFDSVSMFSELIVNRTAESLSLSNGIDIEVRAANFSGLRGVTCVAVIADEAAYWANEDESKNADTEILNAVRPTLATTGGLLAIISSPYAQKGEVFQLFTDHYGAKGDPRILVVKGASRDFNPSLPQTVIDRAMKRDPIAAASDYLAQFRSADAESYITRAAVMSCVVANRHELAPVDGVIYIGVIDPSGLGGKDSYAACIGHRDEQTGKVVIDVVREWRTGSPHDVSLEIAELLSRYGIRRVYGDAWGSNFVREPLKRTHSIDYVQLPMSKSEAYLEFLAVINSGAIELLCNDRAIQQICSLERRTGRAHDTIDAPGGAPEDVANVIACCAVMVGKTARRGGAVAVGVETFGSRPLTPYGYGITTGYETDAAWLGRE